MPYRQFDRSRVSMRPLAERVHKKHIERDHISIESLPGHLSEASQEQIAECAARIRAARESNSAVMMAFGAHAIKNGLALVLARLVDNGWVTHLATNGAGVIHDWEFAFHGQSCEDVQRMVQHGQFGNWQETGFYLNLAINIGAYEGKGYGESVGALIENEELTIPSVQQLRESVQRDLDAEPGRSAAAADLLQVVQEFQLGSGVMSIGHAWKRFSLQAAAFRAQVPLTGHPMLGHDIIYNHPMNQGASVGRTAERDFLTFAESVSQLSGGVYLSIGSAVMSPMVFEKSLSIAQNVALGQGSRIEDFFIQVVDLAKSDWDWSRGEPPEDNPAYYLRYNKSFSRMGGTMQYLQADNRDFLLALLHELEPSTA